jgi:hypothetical protein
VNTSQSTLLIQKTARWSSTNSHINNRTTIPKAYHLVEIETMDCGLFCMKNIKFRNRLYEYCISASNKSLNEQEKRGR